MARGRIFLIFTVALLPFSYGVSEAKSAQGYSAKKAVYITAKPAPMKSAIPTMVGNKIAAPNFSEKVPDGTPEAKNKISDEEDYLAPDELNRKKTKGGPFKKVARVSAKPVNKKTQAPKGKNRFAMPTRISTFLTYSTLVGSSSIIGGDASAVLAPSFEIRPGKSLILLYNGSFQRKKQVFAEDQGPRQSTEFTTHTLTPMYQYRSSSKLTITPSLFRTWALTKESSGDKWFQGLYDYRDLGAGIDFAYAVDTSKERSSTFMLTLQRYERRYPNFRSLISIAGISNLEEHEKDFIGTLFSAAYAVKKQQGLSVTTAFSSLFKNYRDKQIEDTVGGRTGEKQKDQIHTVNLILGYRPGESWNYGITGTFSYNESNQNLATGSFPDITFEKNYFSSYTTVVKPNISYVRRLSRKHALKLSGSYSLTNIKYADRLAKDASGTLTTVKETDWTHDITLNALYALNRRWSIGAILNYSSARSNTKDESVFRFNYDIVNVSAGLTYQY